MVAKNCQEVKMNRYSGLENKTEDMTKRMMANRRYAKNILRFSRRTETQAYFLLNERK